MIMPDVTELFCDPDVGGGQSFQVERTTKVRVLGGGASSASIFSAIGSIQPAQPDELQQIPEEDRKNAVMAFRSSFAFQMGSDDDVTNILPDVIIYNGQRYRVLKLDNWSAYGWQCAFATLA